MSRRAVLAFLSMAFVSVATACGTSGQTNGQASSAGVGSNLQTSASGEKPTWFSLDAPQSSPPGDSSELPPDRVPAVKQAPDGPRSLRLQQALTSIVPEGSKVVDSVDLADGSARVAFELRSGYRIMVTQEKLETPLPIDYATFGSKEDNYSRLASGSELLQVNHGLPDRAQVLLARPGGTLINVSLVAPPTPKPPPRPDMSATALKDLVVSNLDNVSVDI
jgi:hypothetical protein